jgi:hypothetical protein
MRLPAREACASRGLELISVSPTAFVCGGYGMLRRVRFAHPSN